jgi:LysR family nitrogen assimilation transcriptional regulator
VGLSFRQIRSFVAVYEEGSFTAAAEREAATQSGMSQHVKMLEEEIGTSLFVRKGRAVTPTPAGKRYYAECTAAMRRLDMAGHEIRGARDSVVELKVGLMPTFTRVMLAPALRRFMQAMSGAEVRITEAYSGVLTEQVRRGDLDFAIVPAFQGGVGLTATLLLRDREMLVAAAGRTGESLAPVRLGDLGPLRIVLPGAQNTRRQTIETYLATNGIDVRQRLELDAMMGTLEFVAASDWVAILPSVMLVGDLDGARFEIRPLATPSLYSEFVLIEAARRGLSPAARLFADMLAEEARQTVVLRQARLGQDD